MPEDRPQVFHREPRQVSEHQCINGDCDGTDLLTIGPEDSGNNSSSGKKETLQLEEAAEPCAIEAHAITLLNWHQELRAILPKPGPRAA